MVAERDGRAGKYPGLVQLGGFIVRGVHGVNEVFPNHPLAYF